MKTRMLAISLLLLVAVATSAFGQSAPDAAQRQADPAIAKIIKHLGLTREQALQIRDIVQQYRQDVQGIVKSGMDDAKKAQIRELRDRSGNAIMAVLNADQKAKAEKMRLVELLLAPPRMGRVGAGILFALSKLDLNNDQKSMLKGIVGESRTAAKAIMSDTSLDKAAKRTKLAEVKKTTQAKVMAVLTPQQQEKLKAIMAKGKEALKNRGAK